MSATNASGFSLIPPGTGVTFSSQSAATLSTNSLTTPSGGAVGTIYAIYDPTSTLNDPIVAGSVAQSGYQQTNPEAIGVLAGQANSVGYTQSVNPINVYSFALAPEEHQPSGSCNFSRIDTTTLVFDSIVGMDGRSLAAGSFPSKNYPYLFRMYAVNYNIFRVMSGMGGLAYSN